MKKSHILWIDDEIDLLKAHIIFLEAKGYKLSMSNNGHDAIALCNTEHFDLVFLDENMPGLSGLDTLLQIKKDCPSLPVIMITKSEEEDIMEQAIGQKIADYLIKPVNPNQILLAIKKAMRSKEIITEKTTSKYQSEFMKIGTKINDASTIEDWQNVYKNLVYWELEIEEADHSMEEMLQMQKSEANASFSKFIKKNYADWFQDQEHRPIMSPDIFKKRVFPLLDAGDKVFLIVIDNFRLDHWRIFQQELSNWFNFDIDDTYISILPTSTQYARNAIFAGLMPEQIRQMFPNLWVTEEEDGKNSHEEELIQTQLDRFRKKYDFSYHKILNSQAGEKLNDNINQLLINPLNVVVFNFVDILSHARTEVKLFRELVPDESAYRSLVLSWFKHSFISNFFRTLAEKKVKIVLTTDHGSIRVKNPIKVIGDKNTSTNLRYKLGRSLNYDNRQVLAATKPQDIGLPTPNISSTYIFAQNTDFFAYPNNYNHYVSYYKDSFQHGGISMEEMIIPLITMSSKK